METLILNCIFVNEAISCVCENIGLSNPPEKFVDALREAFIISVRQWYLQQERSFNFLTDIIEKDAMLYSADKVIGSLMDAIAERAQA
jgi:hypothetical protein